MLFFVILVLIVFFLCLAILVFLTKLPPSPIQSQTTSNIDNIIENHQINYSYYYRPKRYVITLNELNFYTVLMEVTKELDLILFSQVSLYNIIETKDNLDYSTKTSYFNKIASKSIDFVLVDKKDCRIKLCIELDDTSHKKQNRIERDKFINQLFEDLEINLLRYPSYNVYYKDTLKKRIQENMREHYYTD